MTIKRHPRSSVVAGARRELDAFVLQVAVKHQLTLAELVGIVGGILSTEAKYAIRAERHPNDPDKGGDEA